MTQTQQATLLAESLESIFGKIEREQMAGIPILNPVLRVQTLGFQHVEGGTIGIVITPWLMSLIYFPKNNEDLARYEIGKKLNRKFPSGNVKFMLNEFDELGRFLSHSIHSPMNAFSSQKQAILAAEQFLDSLLTTVDNPDDDPLDEELLGRILRGEEVPEADMDELAVEEQYQNSTVDEGQVPGDRDVKSIDRRGLLKGEFLNKS